MAQRIRPSGVHAARERTATPPTTRLRGPSPTVSGDPRPRRVTAADFDIAVIGAGFGGLGTALAAAERGARVVLLETLAYPGGCASTFTRGGVRYESGATLFSGFAPDQLFAQWIARHALDVRFVPLDPVITLRAPGLSLAVPPDRARLVESIATLPGAPSERVRAFFAEQARVAEALWALLADPTLLPPFGAAALLRHAARLPQYLPVLRVIGKPLASVLARHGLADFAPLRTYVDAISQITVQASAAEAEAPFALSTLDYPFRGTGHVHGGVGKLAWGLVAAIRALGGEVRLPDRVNRVTREGDGYVLTTRKGTVRARRVVLNLLPQDAAKLLDVPLPSGLAKLAGEVARGWGAAMLYLRVRADAVHEEGPAHLELVNDANAPFLEGNHVFCSVSGLDEPDRAPPGERTVTVSTHVPLPRLEALEGEARGAYVAEVQAAMRRTIEARAPELAAGIVHAMTGSPRTFARFTGRAGGAVGGVPRRAGLHHYVAFRPPELARGAFLVGDSVFPGQSTLATALAGVKLAEALAR